MATWLRSSRFQDGIDQGYLRSSMPKAAHKLQAGGIDSDPKMVKLNHMVQYSTHLDSAFAALSDPTRRGILERLGRGDASISDLAESFDMTLTGMKKHVQILESAGLVTTQKVGRVRICRLGPQRLQGETEWIGKYQQMLEARLDRLGELLERTREDQP
jgi:DNA-binding transcriptional ArsR family regulator